MLLDFFTARRGQDKKSHSTALIHLVLPTAGGSTILYLGWKYLRPVLKRHLLFYSPTTRLCDNCHANVPKHNRYCPLCGEADNNDNAIQYQNSTCIYCRAALSNDHTGNCTECGKPVPNQVIIVDEPRPPQESIRNATNNSSRSRSVARSPQGFSPTTTRVADHPSNANIHPTAAILPQQQQPVFFEPQSNTPPMVLAELMVHPPHNRDSSLPSVPLVHATPVEVQSSDDAHYSNRNTRRYSSFSRRDSLQHADLCQRHAPVMNELRNLMARNNNGTTATTTTRAARVLSNNTASAGKMQSL